MRSDLKWLESFLGKAHEDDGDLPPWGWRSVWAGCVLLSVGDVPVYLDTDEPRHHTINTINVELSGRQWTLEYWDLPGWVELYSPAGKHQVLSANVPLGRAVMDSSEDKMAEGLCAFVHEAKIVISTQGGLACTWVYNRKRDGVLTFNIQLPNSSQERVTLQKGISVRAFAEDLLAACAITCGSEKLSAVKLGLDNALNMYLAKDSARLAMFTGKDKVSVVTTGPAGGGGDGQDESAVERVLGVHIDALKTIFQKESVPLKLITGPDCAHGEWQRLVQLGTGLTAYMLFLDTRSYATGEEGYVARWKATEQALLYAGHRVSPTLKQELQDCIKQFAYSLPLLGNPNIDGELRPVDAGWTEPVKQITPPGEHDRISFKYRGPAKQVQDEMSNLDPRMRTLDNATPKRDPYAEHRLAMNAKGLELHPGISTTVRERHMRILLDDLNKKLVVMATQDDTWGGENP